MQQETIKKYHPLGIKTLIMFIIQKGVILIILLPLLLVGVFGLSYIPSSYVDVVANGVIGYFIILLVIFLLAILVGWLQYFRYWIFVDDKDLKVARGLISVEQIGVPYRRIQDVKIQRSLIDQLFGVSDIIITVMGSGDNQANLHNPRMVGDEDILILPALSKEIALEIQDIVLKKAQVDQVAMVGTQRI